MVPVPSCPSQWNYWDTFPPSDCVELTCLLPNSVYIPLTISSDATLQDVKEELWDRAVNYPLFGMLREMSSYAFQYVSALADTEEVDEETMRICDLRPVCGVLVIIEKSESRPEEDVLNRNISRLIGKSLKDYDNLRSSEVNEFRIRMRYLAEETLIKRSEGQQLDHLRHQCPPRLAEEPVTPITLRRHLNDDSFRLVTYAHNREFRFSSNVPLSLTPHQHIEGILRKLANLNVRGEQAEDYVLKVCGREEYLFGDHPLIQFLYIQEMLSNDSIPHVMTVNIDEVPLVIKKEVPCLLERRRMTAEHSNTMRRKKNESSWNIDQHYTCVIERVSDLNVTNTYAKVVCQVGIFHGGKALCETRKTRSVLISTNGDAEWAQTIVFPIKVSNLPRMARLCFGIYEIVKFKSRRKLKDSTKETMNRLTWANTMIFDYKEQLRTDGVTLSMWTHAADDTQGDLILHPLGSVAVNPNTDSCATLQVRFSNYNYQHPILYPRLEAVLAHTDDDGTAEEQIEGEKTVDGFDALLSVASRDPMFELHEQDRRKLWGARKRLSGAAPELLPKLLSCVEWGERAFAAGVPRLLARWPSLQVESALELLDYAYADAAVRSFAVTCLSAIGDTELLLYLLQLVQALKHEPYLMCDLAVFLLKRAYANMTVGHYLFWHLRSEIQTPSVSIRFGLMLEAYCRGCQEHIKILQHQVTCLEKLKSINSIVRQKKEISKARAALTESLQDRHFVGALHDFVSPLNPSLMCKRIKAESCRVMDSKMRPLMLDFENADPCGSDIRVILKIGDDLRQDMFTLQMLRLMDRLWKNHGYDFRLNPYNCISMESTVGMIEVVEEAETIANIQKQNVIFNAASTISRATLLQWLRKHTSNELAFNKVVDEFTMSCAGYCVATYVLGIADRHSDNIMVRKNGQLFHIDFGHFLGHFKQKYGFRRERVPFVLTHDIIYVINKGRKGTGDNEQNFKKFKEYCENAFKILRKHGHLILTLFSMMISTGLPELSSEKDLQYLRETLVMYLPEDKALEHFQQKFNEAVKNSWTTSFNWAIHNFDKNN
ncbi:hypothetical protein K1T71_003734 [Dendrolimus kikuchii]|uniref:Uncharacterized protein n=1 Tax=Dendrolimus kikuchii TaxID=765133 RepID=A0ACC1D8Z0_9NEOP|nr:hypothetical protein K1T71_003734 [Dendrolimus kikuchii]